MDPNAEEHARAWVRDLWSEIAPHTNGHAYVGYMDSEGPERVRAAYGENFFWLTRIKARYDPTNLFRFNQNIPPAR
jgi:hypothetical protein